MLFVAPFPDSSNNNDGLVQRVAAIDKFFDSDERIYLDISFSKFVVPRIRMEGPVTIVKTNYFNFFWIVYFVKEPKVYFHTIFGFLKTFPLSFIARKKMILDLHGAVPEERAFQGSSWQKSVLNQFEGMAFARCSMFIYVTNAMRIHFQNKYPKRTLFKKHVLFSIIPNNLRGLKRFRPVEPSTDESTTIVYSGGMQKWQNIELVIDCIKMLRGFGYKFLLLTNDKVKLLQMLKDSGCGGFPDLTVASVRPDELDRYYKSAHYGFLFRDDDVVNRVACPTKAVEYMYYGLIPLVKSPDIGDLGTLGYEHVTIDELRGGRFLKPQKNLKNHEIVASMIAESSSVNIKLLSDNL